jgi:hypothetical protein
MKWRKNGSAVFRLDDHMLTLRTTTRSPPSADTPNWLLFFGHRSIFYGRAFHRRGVRLALAHLLPHSRDAASGSNQLRLAPRRAIECHRPRPPPATSPRAGIQSSHVDVRSVSPILPARIGNQTLTDAAVRCLPPRASPCARLPHSDHTRITASSIGIELISKQIRTRLEASTPPRLDHMRRTSDFRTRRHRRLMWRHREEAPHRKPVNPASLQVTLISFSHIRFLLECHPGPIAICAHKYFFSRTLMMLLCSCPPRTTGGHGQERPNCS